MKKIYGLFMMVILISTMTGCGNKEGSKASGQESVSEEHSYEPVKLRAAYMPNMGGASLLVTAKQFGFFDKYGLNVELVEFGDGTAEIAAMASGDIDFAMIGHGAHALCAEGSAMVFYADAIGLSSAVVANKSHGINQIEDLRGKKVAYVAGTSSEELLVLALSKAEMTMEDIEAINFDVSGMVTAMASGQVDAAASSQPYTSTIKGQLGADFLQLRSDNDFLNERALMNSEICTSKFAENNPDVLVKIACALIEAANYRAEHIEDVAVAVAKQCQGDKDTFLSLTEECMWLTGEDVKSHLEKGTLNGLYENAQTAFLNSGRLKTPVPVEDYIMFDVIKAAVEIVYPQ
jgi:NitT/TauT family transport system substrate-binding protein